MNKKMMCIVCGIMVCITMVAPVMAQPTPFVICGYVFDSGSNPCNGSTVQITNLDTDVSRNAENSSTSHYYQLVLVNGTDLNASETLRVNVTSPDGSQSKIVEFKITQDEVNAGGRFGFNITLSVPNQQTWYFTNDTVTGPTWSGAAYNRNMTKGVEGEDDKITLAKGERVWFYADQLAECNVSFPAAGKWNVSYRVNATNATDSGKQITTRLQGINSTGAKLSGSPYAEGHYNIKSPQNLEEVTESLNASGNFTIPKDGRFAIEVLWAGGAAGNLEIYCNPVGVNASQVTSPTSDPGYPIPELPTVILLGLGLLVFVGYVGWWRRRKE